ncbi:NUDIX domain-containing protein [Corynebacterium mendelii]|uniref:NUDIX domain-containing protein n=1 Tax=Corynebacterium mendelii TaxID=2765362 RepID=A0A939IXZ2_9CORY|nr:NUDIX domain-containing protein [Corynebacterium mendelii]MBN9644573.1 NUDIX domain-containing protein [Corynebacterium mendelii]
MATPPFIVDLRAKIGHDPLWLPGVTGIVLRPGADGQADEVLLVQRVDNGQWTPVTGICDPGEQPGDAIVREIREETGITARIRGLIGVEAVGPVTYPNGDVSSYMDTSFSLVAVDSSAEPTVGDDESTAVRWCPVDELPPMKDRFVRTIGWAVEGSSGHYGGGK